MGKAGKAGGERASQQVSEGPAGTVGQRAWAGREGRGAHPIKKRRVRLGGGQSASLPSLLTAHDLLQHRGPMCQRGSFQFDSGLSGVGFLGDGPRKLSGLCRGQSPLESKAPPRGRLQPDYPASFLLKLLYSHHLENEVPRQTGNRNTRSRDSRAVTSWRQDGRD